jgi:DNA polymerase
MPISWFSGIKLKDNMKNYLLKWYYNMGVEDIISNVPNALGEKKTFIKPSILSAQLGSREIIEYAYNLTDSCTSLAQLKDIVHNFTGCNLKKTATNTVFADGCEKAKIMLIGEAPGANEDATGVPFCGDSGKLLDAIFASIGYDRTNLYITNSIFWRPPGNRRPSNEEIAICLPFVEKHIALIKPKLIILVGSTAVASVMNIHDSMSSVRKRFFDYKNKYLDDSIKCCAIYHPSYLMRQPSQKKNMWQDLLIIEDYINGLCSSI